MKYVECDSCSKATSRFDKTVVYAVLAVFGVGLFLGVLGGAFLADKRTDERVEGYKKAWEFDRQMLIDQWHKERQNYKDAIPVYWLK